MAVNRYDDTLQWYTVSTYSGYEDKVAESIKQRLDSAEFKGKILDAIVPKEKQIEIKNGKRKIVDRKIFQGYVLVQMRLSDETWYIIRNTPGVTGFVGTGTQPTPVSEKEINKIKKRMGVEDPTHLTKLSPSPMVHSRASKVPLPKSTPARVSFASWFLCSAVKRQSNLTPFKLKKLTNSIKIFLKSDLISGSDFLIH